MPDKLSPSYEYEHYTDARGNHRVRFADGLEVCDFCLTPDPTWTYPQAPMPIIGHHIVTHSDDDWGACDICHRLIQQGHIGRFVRWCVEEQCRRVPEGTRLPSGIVHYPPLSIRIMIQRENVLRFMDARNGPPTRVA